MWDPLRKKEVAATPEEQVRQWFIGVLRDSLGVPEHLMMSEVGFRYGGKQYRADILVYGHQAQRLAIVECKRPEVELTSEVLDQALRYNMVLDVTFLIITNGKKTFAFKKEDNSFVQLTNLPNFSYLYKL